MVSDGSETPSDIRAAVSEVDHYVSAAGWEQPTQLFALVHTAELLQDQPHLAEQLHQDSPLTPVAQEALPETPLDAALAGIAWPDSVAGCALSLELLTLPESADDLDAEQVAQHPGRREARMSAAVLRDGSRACLLRFRVPVNGQDGDRDTDRDGDRDTDQDVIAHPDLAPHLTDALLETFRADNQR